MTTDELIQAVREYANVGTAAEDSQDDQLLRRLNTEQTLYLTTILQKSKGQHRQATLDWTTSSTVLRYDIPTRAIAAGIKMAQGVDASGQSWMLYDFPDEDNARYGRFFVNNGQFYIEGNQLVFYAAPPAGTLRITYSRRMNTLVKLASVGIITNINTGTGVVAISPTPAGFGTAAANYDFVRASPHFDILAMDKSATRSSGNMTFAVADLPTGLAVGDYVCLAGQSAVSQAPLEAHPLLAIRCAYVWSRAKNDPAAMGLKEEMDTMAGMVATLLEPRIEQESPLVNRYAPGFNAWPFVRRVF